MAYFKESGFSDSDCKIERAKIMSERFINELEMMKKCYSPNFHSHDVLYIDEFLYRQREYTQQKSEFLSNEFRQRGNFIMRNNGALNEAANYYMNAILYAPVGSESVGLAHANRSLALKKLGFLAAAYDDCLFALERNYPKQLHYKVVCRQAEICKELGESEKFNIHVKQLEEMVLSGEYQRKFNSLKSEAVSAINKSLTELKAELEKTENSQELAKIAIKSKKNQQSICAKMDIKKGETVFTDQAFIVCPPKGAQVCHNCGDFLIVPFPCVVCLGDIIYCSFKCQKAHLDVHQHECLFYQIKNEDSAGWKGIYLRTLLKGLPQILPVLKDKPNANSLWSECFNINKHKDIIYMDIIRSRSVWGTSDAFEHTLMNFMECPKEIICFIQRFTSFLDILSGTSAPLEDWKIFLSALLLRHMGQSYIYFNHFNTIVSTNVNLLSPKIPKGALFKCLKYNNFLGFYVFPKLSHCKHSFSHGIETKIDGQQLIATALTNIKAGNEVTLKYDNITTDYFSINENELHYLSKFFPNCECTNCKNSKYERFKKSYTFVCQNPSCKKTFSIKSCEDFRFIKCWYCKKDIGFNFYKEWQVITSFGLNSLDRQLLFGQLQKFDKFFHGFNKTKLDLYHAAILSCIKSHHSLSPLRLADLEKMQGMIGEALEAIDHLELNSGYKMLFCFLLWDIITLKNKKIDKHDLRDSLELFKKNMLEREYLFVLKYYTDHIAPLIKSD